MNDNEDFEADLRRLGQAMQPNDGFVGRVMSRLDRPRSASRWWIGPLAMAATVLVVLGYFALAHSQERKATPGGDDLRLVSTTSEWQTSARRVLLDGQVPAQEISRQRFERDQWDDARSNTTFERLVPKEKITFISADSY